MKSPFLSVVIATYNYGSMLEEAICSVINQSDKDFELIIVDGGSKDNTVDVIRKYEKYISWWVSEPDRGQSDAFNKGFTHAKGEVITWLNADDLMLPNTISVIKKCFANRNVDWVAGNMVCFDTETKKITKVFFGPSYYPKFLQGANKRISVFGPSSFWRRSLYNKIGPINEDLHYTMDNEYWARLTIAGVKLYRTNHYCWGFRIHEKSKTASEFSHERPKEVAEKVALEWKHINGLGYRLSKKWEIIYLLGRILDMSYLRGLIYNKLYAGKDVKTFNCN